MQHPEASILLSVNDFNLVRRYAAEGSWVQAKEKDVGIINAGSFYMGLLADPYQSFEMGFKKTLVVPELISLA
jgi:hypothetical protein